MDGAHAGHESVAEHICRVVAPYCSSRLIASITDGSATSDEALIGCLGRLASMPQMGESGEPVSVSALEVGTGMHDSHGQALYIRLKH